MAQKKTESPEDPVLRREYFSRFGASVIHDAHFLGVYIDEQLASECGMVSPSQLLQDAMYSKAGFTLGQFTTTQAYCPEGLAGAFQDESVAKKVPVLTANAPMFYGFWGRVYNAVMDNEPAEIYELLQEWIDGARANLEQVHAKFVPDDLNPRAPNPPVAGYVTTTLTDSQARNTLERCEVAELQGSVRRFLCGRACCTKEQQLNEAFRFPVGIDGLVDEFQTRVGQELEDPSYGFISPLAGLIQREENTLKENQGKKKKPAVVAKPPAPKKKPEAPKGGDDKDKKPKKPKKAKVSFSEEGFPLPDPDCVPEAPVFQEAVLAELPASSTHPKCAFCQAPMRFAIQPCKFPAPYKKFITEVTKWTQMALSKDQAAVINGQHNDYQTTRSQSLVKTIPNYKFVLLELGYNRNFQKVHDENLKAILGMKGQGCIVRIAKPSDEARAFSFDGIENYKTSIQLDPNFIHENYCYCIETDNVRNAVSDLMRLFRDRKAWIGDWDDMKKRKEKYLTKAKK